MPMATSASTMMAAAAATTRPPLRPLPGAVGGGASFMIGLRRSLGSATYPPPPFCTVNESSADRSLGKCSVQAPAAGEGKHTVAAANILHHVEEKAAAAGEAEPGLAGEAQ